MSIGITKLWILVAVADAVIMLFAYFNWRGARRGNPAFCMNFRVTDLWAATVGLAPAFVYFATLLKGAPQDQQMAPLMLALLVPHQICGMVIALLRTERGSTVENSSAVGSFIMVLGGAVLGLVLPAFSLTLACAVPIAVILFVLLSPFLVPLMLGLHIYKKKYPASAETPIDQPPRNS